MQTTRTGQDALTGPRSRALAWCASAHGLVRLALGLLLAATAILSTLACGRAGASSEDEALERERHSQHLEALAGIEEEAGPQAGRAELPNWAHDRIADMIESWDPLDPTVTSNHQDRWLIENQRMMEEIWSGPTELGLAAMHAYADYRGEDLNTRRRLLQVAARNSPEDARGLLEHLMTEYGYHISDRTEATSLLAESSPESYLVLAEPYLTRRTKAAQTMAPDEFLVDGWITACNATGRSPVPELADVVTNLMFDDAARHLAAKALQHYPDILSQRALETALIESSGNGYLRRMAAQSLVVIVPRETICELFRTTLEREVDTNFAAFLRSMIEKHCR